jgi:hypothetical protein
MDIGEYARETVIINDTVCHFLLYATCGLAEPFLNMPEEKQLGTIPDAPVLTDAGNTQVALTVDAQTNIVPSKQPGGLQAYPMTDAVQQLSDSGVLRNQGVTTLLAVLCKLRETDLNDAKAERESLENETNTWYHKWRGSVDNLNVPSGLNVPIPI